MRSPNMSPHTFPQVVIEQLSEVATERCPFWSELFTEALRLMEIESRAMVTALGG